MKQFIRDVFVKNIGLKFISLVLALAIWFYVVGELNKGSEEERQILRRMLPSESMAAKKLTIRPIFIGKPREGYELAQTRMVILPEYCIVVGSRDMLGKIRSAYTMPIDLSGVSKTFTKSVPLNPIAPGIYMEETLVQVTVPIEKSAE